MSVLSEEFDYALHSLASGAERQSLVESVMRLRALGELAGQLDTRQLLELAVSVGAGVWRADDRPGAALARCA